MYVYWVDRKETGDFLKESKNIYSSFIMNFYQLQYIYSILLDDISPSFLLIHYSMLKEILAHLQRRKQLVV